MTPQIEFEGAVYLLMTPLLAGLSRADLGPECGDLSENRNALLASMEFLLTGI
jgi:toxin CcdB